MCLPTRTDKTQTTASTGGRAIFGLGAVMLLACIAGPLLGGAAAALGVGLLAGVGGAVFALALCIGAPAALVAWRRR